MLLFWVFFGAFWFFFALFRPLLLWALFLGVLFWRGAFFSVALFPIFRLFFFCVCVCGWVGGGVVFFGGGGLLLGPFFVPPFFPIFPLFFLRGGGLLLGPFVLGAPFLLLSPFLEPFFFGGGGGPFFGPFFCPFCVFFGPLSFLSFFSVFFGPFLFWGLFLVPFFGGVPFFQGPFVRILTVCMLGRPGPGGSFQGKEPRSAS